MSDELLPYYERELSFFRRLAAGFADAHPKIARRLRLGEDVAADPHVERMIQAFAYLNARIRHKLEDDFPEITEALLGVLYPHYQAPIPSMAVAQFDLDPAQNQLTVGYPVARGTELQSDSIPGEVCLFRTCFPVTLWPIEVKSAALGRPPFPAPRSRYAAPDGAILRLVLGSLPGAPPLAALNLGPLRFFLKGQPQHVFRLYELILNNTAAVALATSSGDPEPVVVGKGCLRPAGFGPDEGMFPQTPRSFPGYRLLSEFFTFPQKFLFFDLTLERRALGRAGHRLEVYLYLNEAAADLEQEVSADTFRLGCSPVVNLYARRAEGIELTHTDFEYRVVPDARRPLAHEVYSIDRVVGTAPDRGEVEFFPFFSIKHAAADRDAPTFWHVTRRQAEPAEGSGDAGTDVYLSFVDLGFRPSAPADGTVDVETTCLNRDLPSRLPFGADQPRLQFREGGALVSRVSCLTPPTRTLRPASKRGALWRLISHLSLNHLSLLDAGAEDSSQALREILKLYDFADSAGTRRMLDGIRRVRSRRDVGRPAGAPAGVLCRGVEVTIHFDESAFSGSGVFLFASVLERFLALYCSVNSFSRLVATVEGREGELCRWQPRTGEQVVL